MEITFRTHRLLRIFDSDRNLRRQFGAAMTRTIVMRMNLLRESATLSEIPTTSPERRHILAGQRRGQYAVDLLHPYRLVFVPNHFPVPTLGEGGVDLDRVTAIEIIEVIDYH